MKKNQKHPKVSIVLPVYNAERYLKETLDSVLRQTFADFECVVTNDGSTDGSMSIINEYAARDRRIIPHNQENRGLVATLNESIGMARGEYIARVDADDPSFEDRLLRQVALLEKNTDVVLVGGGFEIIDESGYFIETIHTPTRDEDIRRAMMLRNPLGHAGVMFRKSAFEKTPGYSNEYGPTEDMHMWQLLSEVGLLASIPEPVYRYRIAPQSISQTNSIKQSSFAKAHISAQWKRHTPRLLSRYEILTQANRYFHSSSNLNYCIGLKNQFLEDNVQLGVKLIRNGNVLIGFCQILSVGLVGRSGIRAVKKRLSALDLGSFKQVRKNKD